MSRGIDTCLQERYTLAMPIKILPSDLEPNLATYERGVNSKSASFARKCRNQIKTTMFAARLAQRLADGKPEILVYNVAHEEWVTVIATNLSRPNAGTFVDWIVDYKAGGSSGFVFLAEIRLPGKKVAEPEYPSHELQGD